MKNPNKKPSADKSKRPKPTPKSPAKKSAFKSSFIPEDINITLRCEAGILSQDYVNVADLIRLTTAYNVLSEIVSRNQPFIDDKEFKKFMQQLNDWIQKIQSNINIKG